MAPTLEALIPLLHRRVTDPAVIDLVARHGKQVQFLPGDVLVGPSGISLELFKDTVQSVLLASHRQSFGRYMSASSRARARSRHW